MPIWSIVILACVGALVVAAAVLLRVIGRFASRIPELVDGIPGDVVEDR